MAYQMINNLRYGQVSPKMAGRIDLDVYRQGAEKVENFICMRQGGITRRPPVKFLSDIDSNVVRIVPLTIDTTMSLLLCLSEEGFTPYTYILSTGSFEKYSDLCEWAKDYSPSSSDIKEMCFAQHYDYLYVTCRNQKLGRFKYTATNVYFEICNVILNEVKTEVQEQGFAKDTLMTNSTHYPAGCAIISDRLLLFGTRGEKDTVWWSRVLGSSQVLEDQEDSLLDFRQYDEVETETEQMKDSKDWTLTQKLDVNGNILTHLEIIGGGSTKQAIYKTSKARDDSSFDGKTDKLYQAVKTSTDTFDGTVGKIYVFEDSSYTTPYQPSGRKSNALEDLVKNTDYYEWSYWDYDISDTSDIIETVTETDYVATSTTAMKMQLATGRQDRILWVSILENIYIGTETSIWSLPVGINALAQSAQRIASHPLFNIKPVEFGGTLSYVLKGGKVMALSASTEVTDSELTLTSDGIISSPVVGFEEMQQPEPSLYIVLDNGEMRVLTINTYYGLQGWTSWTFPFLIKGIAKIEDGENVKLVCLVTDNGKKWLGYFDFDEELSFKDYTTKGDINISSTLTLHRLDSYSDGGATLGERKGIRNIVFRTLNSGKAIVGYSDNDMETTPKELGSSDFKMAVNGGTMNELRFTIKSFNDEPLMLLALAYEARINA